MSRYLDFLFCKFRTNLQELNLKNIYLICQGVSHFQSLYKGEGISSSYVKTKSKDTSAFYMKGKFSMWNLVPSNALHTDRWEELRNLIRGHASCTEHYLQMGQKLQGSWRCRKKNWLRVTPSLRADRVNSQLLLSQHPTRTLRRAVADLGIYYSIIQTILKKLAHRLQYQISSTPATRTELCSTSSQFPIVGRRHVVQFRFPTWTVFLIIEALISQHL